MKKTLLAGAVAFALALLPEVASAQQVFQHFVSQTPVVSNAVAYAAGDLVGGKLTFANALRKSTGLITGALVLDKDKQGADLDLIIFSADPTGTTFTDNGVFAPATADLANIVAVVQITADSAFSANGVSFNQNISVPVYTAAGGNLYGALVTRSAQTYTSTSAITLLVAFTQD